MNIGGVVGTAGSCKLFVEDGDLTVENQAYRRQRGDCVGEAWETTAMVDAATPD